MDEQLSISSAGDDQYELGRDSMPCPGRAVGTTRAFHFADSRTFPGYARDWWLYTPVGDWPAPFALTVFQDGRVFCDPDGVYRTTVVLDNLIARAEVPPMAALFVDPGFCPTRGSNRSFEYDSVGDVYANFLCDEILPVVREQVRLAADPSMWAIAGRSSGGFCAFNAAWCRPDLFRKVFVANGSFTNIRGGHVYPELVRTARARPLRVFQQWGEHDLVTPEWGSWPAANQAMADALANKGYDHLAVRGGGSHAPAHSAAILPDALRWLWRPCA